MRKTKTKKHTRPGIQFEWHPKHYEGARQTVNLARSQSVPLGLGLAQAMTQMIHIIGGLECPAPSNDPHGVYRVGLDGHGLLVIQRRDGSGAWQLVP